VIEQIEEANGMPGEFKIRVFTIQVFANIIAKIEAVFDCGLSQQRPRESLGNRGYWIDRVERWPTIVSRLRCPVAVNMAPTVDQNANRDTYCLRIFAEELCRRAIDDLSDHWYDSGLFSRGGAVGGVNCCRQG
jgi:hypothetical protein